MEKYEMKKLFGGSIECYIPRSYVDVRSFIHYKYRIWNKECYNIIYDEMYYYYYIIILLLYIEYIIIIIVDIERFLIIKNVLLILIMIEILLLKY